MKINVYRTADGTKRYPPHKHTQWEIVSYLSGNGYLYTPERNYPFQPGTVILVPPGVVHGSVSETEFVNISIGGGFETLILDNKPIVVSDNADGECIALAKIIYNNRFGGDELLTQLSNAYVCFLLKRISRDTDIAEAVADSAAKITENAFDSRIDLVSILARSGYAEDYIRSQFKKYTGKTPTRFLNDIRMSRALFLIDVYGNNISLSQISSECGFVDYIYFSKQFKKSFGLSPRDYFNKRKKH